MKIFLEFWAIFKLVRFEVFDATKFQAAQTPVNNDSLGTREQRTIPVFTSWH